MTTIQAGAPGRRTLPQSGAGRVDGGLLVSFFAGMGPQRRANKWGNAWNCLTMRFWNHDNGWIGEWVSNLQINQFCVQIWKVAVEQITRIWTVVGVLQIPKGQTITVALGVCYKLFGDLVLLPLHNKHIYPLVISHSHGKWPIYRFYRWFTY